MRHIRLSNSNQRVLVDNKDHDKLNAHNWCLGTHGYATCSIDGKNVLMHRVISKCPAYKEVDHINRCKLDNRAANLRIVNRSQNNLNRRIQDNNKSGYKGVAFHKGANKWEAYVKYNYKKYYLGLYNTAEEAYLARSSFQEKLIGKVYA